MNTWDERLSRARVEMFVGRERQIEAFDSGADMFEHVCRYLLRPAFSHDAVQRTRDGQVRVHFKKPSKHGHTYAQMNPDVSADAK